MRSTNDRRVTLPSAEVSEAEDRGDVRLRVLGLSTGTLLPMPLPIELERPLEEGVSVRRGVNTLPDPCRLEGVHVGLEVRADWRLGAGALIEGLDDDLLEKGLERIVTDGLLPSNDERDGETERDAPGVNDGLDGAVARGLLRVDEGPDRAIEDDPPERNAEPELRENPDLELELVAPPRLEPR
ncbi:MAG: hypothetical protein JW955_01835 [Sedimentisphaerales bacterium]|nr:hypothetical protein [Sedimentisphaerales bacterium]